MSGPRPLLRALPLLAPWALSACVLSACAGASGGCPDPEYSAREVLAAEDGAEDDAIDDLMAEEDPPLDEGGGSESETAAGPLLLDGTPELRAELAGRLRPYLNTRSATLEDLSPDGARLLVRTRFGETAQIHLIEAPMGARRQLSFGEEPVRWAALLPATGSGSAQVPEAMLYTSDVGGTEDYQLFRLDLSTGRSELLTPPGSRNLEPVLSRDGAQMAWASNARNGRDMDLYLRPTRRPGGPAPEDLLLQRTGHWYPIEISRDGTKLLAGEYLSIQHSRLFVVDLSSRALTELSPASPAAAYRAACFSADGSKVYVSTDREGDFVSLYELELAHPEAPWRALTPDLRWNVEEIALSPDGRSLAFTANEDGYSVLRVLDTRSRRVQPVAGLPRGVISELRFARDAAVLGFSFQGPRQTGDVYSYDLRRRRLSRWTQSELGGLSEERLVEPELVHFPTFDQRQIPAFYYRPRRAEGAEEPASPAPGPTPVVLYIHGGPESQARPWFSPLTQLLASELGVAVLVPNVRGSDGYGKAYLALDNGPLREDSVRDIGALLDWIGGRPELDAQRVGVYGGSYGGYMVLASLVRYGARIRAGVDYVGISNFVTFLENTREYRQDLRRQEYGDERDTRMRAHLSRISPLRHADRIRSALFVIHGANDPRVPASEADQLVRAVREQGQEVWYMLARNEGHGFLRKENHDLFLALTAQFFDQQLFDRN